MVKRTVILLVLLGSLAACVAPDQVAARRCEAAGVSPGDPVYVECFEHEMDRIQAGYAAMAGIGLGLVQASRPTYPMTVIVSP
jgi:hypothetical protein